MNRRGLAWPTAVAIVLALTIAGNFWVLHLATRDPSFAVEPDYYQRAIAWDSTMAEAREDVRLGWSLHATLTPGDSVLHLGVDVADAAGTPLADLTIAVTATHNARASDVWATRLTSRGPGHYEGTLPSRRVGIWILTFAVSRGAERFVVTEHLDTGPPASTR